MGEAEREAIENFRKIYEKIQSLDKAQKSYRTRARNFPSLMMQMGITAALSFLAGKAEKKYLNEAKNLLRGERVNDNEKLGYALYLYTVLWRIERILGKSLSEDVPERITDTMRVIEEHSKLLEKMLIPYLIQVKSLSEAALKGD